MQYETFIKHIITCPIIETRQLLLETKKPNATRVQVSRWEKAGKLIQLKRGIYILSSPYRKIEPYLPYAASLLKKPSYISLEKALEYHDLIPEAVPVFTSVTTKGPSRFETPLGVFEYRHIRPSLFWGYASVTIRGQTGFMALPEKSLLDLIYLRHGKISADFIRELRLQNVDKINIEKLLAFARKFNKPKVLEAARLIKDHVLEYQQGEKTL